MAPFSERDGDGKLRRSRNGIPSHGSQKPADALRISPSYPGGTGNEAGRVKTAPAPYGMRPPGQRSEDGSLSNEKAAPDLVAALSRQLFDGRTIPAVITDVSAMQARWQATLTRPLARMAGMLLIGLLGMVLCVQGVYAVAAGSVAARSHELAVRSALGALPGQMAWNVTRGLILAVTAGTGLGAAATLGLQPILSRWLGAPAAWQMPAIAVAFVLLAMAAAAGCWFPARAAMRMDPVELLRQG